MSGFVYNNLELNEYPEYPFTHFRINSYYDARKNNNNSLRYICITLNKRNIFLKTKLQLTLFFWWEDTDPQWSLVFF